MTAEVSTLLERVVEGYKDEGEGKKTELVTRDLLGGCAAAEVDLELRVPAAWESRLSPSAKNMSISMAVVGEGTSSASQAQSRSPPSARPQPLAAFALRHVPRPQAAATGNLRRPRRVPQRLHLGEGQVRARAGVAPRHQLPSRSPPPPGRRLPFLLPALLHVVLLRRRVDHRHHHHIVLDQAAGGGQAGRGRGSRGHDRLRRGRRARDGGGRVPGVPPVRSRLQGGPQVSQVCGARASKRAQEEEAAL